MICGPVVSPGFICLFVISYLASCDGGSRRGRPGGGGGCAVTTPLPNEGFPSVRLRHRAPSFSRPAQRSRLRSGWKWKSSRWEQKIGLLIHSLRVLILASRAVGSLSPAPKGGTQEWLRDRGHPGRQQPETALPIPLPRPPVVRPPRLFLFTQHQLFFFLSVQVRSVRGRVVLDRRVGGRGM